MLDYIESFLLHQSTNNIIVFMSIILLLARFKHLAKRNIITISLFSLFGTFLHELAHYISSLLTNGKPSRFSVLPQKSNNGYTLGYIISRNIKWYNAFIISFAPLVLFILAYYLHTYFFMYLDKNIYTWILYLFLMINLIDSAIPSGQDFKVSFSNSGYIFPVLLSLSYYIYSYIL